MKIVIQTLKALFIACLFLSMPSEAFSNTVIHGKIIGPKGNNVLAKFYPSKYKLEKASVSYDINQNDEFESFVIIEEAQVVQLLFRNKRIDVFVEPGERIGILIEQKQNELEVTYFESGNQNDNSIYHDYQKIFGKEKMIVSSEVYISSELYDELKNQSSEKKFSILQDRTEAQNKFYSGINQKEISKPFKEFISNKITFSHLSYLIFFVKKEELSEIDRRKYENIIVIGLRNKLPHNHSMDYLNFIKLLSKLKCAKTLNREIDSFSNFNDSYTCYNNSPLIGFETKEIILGRLIYFSLNPKNVGLITPYFNTYKETNSNSELLTKIIDRYELAFSLRQGQSAPDFKLKDKQESEKSLEDFKGNKIYISFWAKWCGPCKEEIKKSVNNRKKLENDNIVFVFISIDEDKAKWMNHEITKNQTGVHLFGGDVKDKLMKDFGITSIPRTFLIDNKGSFINNFPPASSDEFVDFIRNR